MKFRVQRMFLDGKGLMTYFFNQEPGTMAASSNITGFSFQYIGKYVGMQSDQVLISLF